MAAAISPSPGACCSRRKGVTRSGRAAHRSPHYLAKALLNTRNAPNAPPKKRGRDTRTCIRRREAWRETREEEEGKGRTARRRERRRRTNGSHCEENDRRVCSTKGDTLTENLFVSAGYLEYTRDRVILFIGTTKEGRIRRGDFRSRVLPKPRIFVYLKTSSSRANISSGL